MPFTDEEEEILTFLRSEQESYYHGDFDAFVDHWHHGPEVRRIISGPQVGTRIHSGWDELLLRFQEGFRQFPQNFEARDLLRWENIQFQITADMAWISYDQIAVKHVPKMHVSPMSHEVKIIQKFKGSWKIICLIVVVPGIRREDVPLIELTADGRVARINKLASERLGAHSGLVVSGGRLHARIRKFDTDLQKAIERAKNRLATNLPRGFQSEPASIVPLGENEAGHPIFCWIATEQERVLISFDDEFLLRGRLEAAVPTFGLSPAQLKLAELLALGQDLGTAALELGVSINTLRTQVRRMFEKTDTHNQAALLSRLLNSQGPD
ncbi:helix-turn-helix transcriptional regulator [Falsihalocynthiibacter sp. S25ZX9]|uniref:helix-turn-helix transcriptional regulator n=1 Tax=Falsihalocynthiibacter sp. S25ZX9 TaxID=3240870 RepID=UPI00350EA513